jgi:hypothetical protein
MPDRQPGARPNKFATALMAPLLVIGFYIPTSLAETISARLQVTSDAILFPILIALLLRRGGVLSSFALVNGLTINVILLTCTLFSPFTEIAYGGYSSFLLLSMLFCVNVKDIRLSVTARRTFEVANAINLILAALVLLQVPAVTQFIRDNYAYGYEGMVPSMLEEGKPVIIFGSHSLAGFFFYLLFYVTLQTFIANRSKLNLVFAFGYLALLIPMYSFTSLVFAGVAIVQLVLCFKAHKTAIVGLIAAALLVATLVVAPQLISDFKDGMIEVSQREGNGLLGRYSEFGGLAANFEFIANHPFRPIGLGLSWRLWNSDSGPAGYILKGSFPLLVAVYAGAFMFFRKNLRSGREALFLYLVFLSFEIGYSNFQYSRTQYFLPFLMVYLNSLERTTAAHSRTGFALTNRLSNTPEGLRKEYCHEPIYGSAG